MAATFPASPTNGQVAEVGGRFYTWNSTTGVWENIGATSGFATIANLAVTGTVTATTVTATSVVGDGSGLTGAIPGTGLFKGNNGSDGDASAAGNLFRINSQTLTANVTISSTENASVTGPLTVADGIVLTVEGNLSIT